MRNPPRYEPVKGARIVELPGRPPVHDRYTMTVEEGTDGPGLEVAVSVVDGQPCVTRLSILRTDPPGVTASDVARLDLRSLFALVAGDARLVDFGAGAVPVSGYGAAAVAGLRRRRNEVTPDRLRDVALVYGSLWDDALPRTTAMRNIAEALGVSDAQAYRLVARARDESDPATGQPYISPNPQEDTS